MIRLPGGRVAMRVAQPVSLLDLAPTLLEMLGIEVPTGIQGRSVVPTLDERQEAPRAAIYAEKVATVNPATGAPSSLKRALTRDKLKLILLPDGRSELYDLAADPGEHLDLAGTAGDRVQSMLQAAERLAGVNDSLRRTFSRGKSSAVTPVDEETLEQLRALGYLK